MMLNGSIIDDSRMMVKDSLVKGFLVNGSLVKRSQVNCFVVEVSIGRVPW